MAKEEIIFNPSEDYLVQISESYELTKNLLLTIPTGYIAAIYADGRGIFKQGTCSKLNILNQAGKAYKGKTIQIACYKANNNAEILYGDGDIPVKNAKLDDTYYVGYSGTMNIELTDIIEIIKRFSFKSSITIADIREKLLPTIQSVATTIVAGKFADSNVSVFEINGLIGEIREEMTKAFVKEKQFENMGIEVTSVTIRPFVKESELERIRNKINNPDNK